MRVGLSALLLFSVLLSSGHAWSLDKAQADEFTALSRQTPLAMGLSVAELEDLLKRCDALREQVEKLEGSDRKILRKKLRRMCGVFDYVLRARMEKSAPN